MEPQGAITSHNGVGSVGQMSYGDGVAVRGRPGWLWLWAAMSLCSRACCRGGFVLGINTVLISGKLNLTPE